MIYTKIEREAAELRNRVRSLEDLVGRTKFSTRDAFENCILIWDTTAKAFRPAASSTSIQTVVVNSVDHGDLTGLPDDDHPQYAQIAGTEGITGDWTFNRGAGTPFTCVSGAGKVTYLDADKVDGYEHDQSLIMASSPTFVALTLSENLITSSTVDGVDVAGLKSNHDTLQEDVDGFPGELKNLVTAEIQQLENIGAVTISSTQWGYLGGSDQALKQADSPTFVGLTLSANLATSSTIDSVDIAALKEDVDGFTDELKNLETAEIQQLENIAAVTISGTQWGYVGALDQALTQASSPSFAGLTLTGNASVQSLIPSATDTYDLGSSTLLWRKGWLSELESVLFVENTVQLIGGWFWIPHGAGSLPGTLTDVATTYDFGQSMSTGDFLLLRNSSQIEYIEIGAVDAGTVYNISRDLDGSGANAWVAGQPYALLGASGACRIELDAQTAGPTLKILEQGATYNTQTERVRIGDLNGWGPVAAQEFGFGLGDYDGGESLYWTATDGLVFNAGVINFTSEGIRIQDANASSREIRWWFDDSGDVRTIGGVYGDAGEGSACLVRLQSERQAVDPWAEVTTVIRSHDYVEGHEVTLTLSGTDGHAVLAGASKLDIIGHLDVSAGNITVSGTVDGVDVAALYAYVLGLKDDVDGFPDTLKNLSSDEIAQITNIDDASISNAEWDIVAALNQALTTTSNVAHNRLYVADYMYALGGVHVGGYSDPGTDNLLVDGYCKVTGEIRQGATDYGGYEIQTGGQIYCNDYIVAMGGLHVGGSSDPGTDNLIVDGDCRLGSGVWIGSTGTTPDDNDLHIDGSINKSTALGCRAYRSSAQSIGTSPTALSWNVQVYDTDAGFAPTSTALYARHAGYYMAGGSWTLNANATASHRMQIQVKLQGSTVLGANELNTVTGRKNTVGVATGMFYMSVNQYIQIYAYQSSGVALYAAAASATTQEKNSGWLMRIA